MITHLSNTITLMSTHLVWILQLKQNQSYNNFQIPITYLQLKILMHHQFLIKETVLYMFSKNKILKQNS